MSTQLTVPTSGRNEVTGFEQSSFQFDLKSILSEAPVRGAYRKLRSGAYKAKLLTALGEAAKRISLGEKPKKGIIRFNENAQVFELHFGIGRRCARFENEFIPTDRTPEFSEPHEVLLVLRWLVELTHRGVFDASLDSKLDERQKHSMKMIRGKAVDSYVSPAGSSH